MSKYNEPFVKVLNPLQFSMYMKHNIKPIDMYYSHSDNRVVFIFTVRESKELYQLWCNRELK